MNRRSGLRRRRALVNRACSLGPSGFVRLCNPILAVKLQRQLHWDKKLVTLGRCFDEMIGD